MLRAAHMAKQSNQKRYRDRPIDLIINLVDHLVLDNSIAIEDFHGDALTGLRVLSELNLRKCSLANRPPDLVLPYFPHHHLSFPQMIFSRSSISAFAAEERDISAKKNKRSFSNRQPFSFHFPKYLLIVRSESKRKSESWKIWHSRLLDFPKENDEEIF